MKNLITLLAYIIEALAAFAHSIVDTSMMNNAMPALVSSTTESYSWDDEDEEDEDDEEDDEDDLDMDWDDEEDEDDDFEDEEEEDDEF